MGDRYLELSEITAELKKIFCDTLDDTLSPEQMPDDFKITDTGLPLDSVESLELVVKIERHFAIAIESHELNREQLSSLPRLSDFVYAKLRNE